MATVVPKTRYRSTGREFEAVRGVKSMSVRVWCVSLLLPVIAFACAPTTAPPEPILGPPPRVVDDRKPVDQIETLTLVPRPLDSGLQTRIEQTIEHVRRRDLLTTNGFWTIFHGILGLGPSTLLRVPETNIQTNALDYICSGGQLRGLQFIATKHGLDVQMGQLGISQGHQDQFVAEMAQWGMPADRPVSVNGQPYTFRDFIRHCQMRARVTSDQELSWALVVIAQYQGTDATWTNENGESLHFEDLVRYELAAPIETAACGGTHRLFGLSWAYHLHLQRGRPATGVWADIAAKTAVYRDKAKTMRNPDGSFSTQSFVEPGHAADRFLRINTTGHIFEWLALALSDQELREPWMEEAANALSLMILDAKVDPIDGGSLYHAVHGLIIYYARRYDRQWLGPLDPPIPLPPKIEARQP